MEEERNEITFGEICRRIWSQKWLALILFLVIALAGTFALKYGYGASKSEYTSTFSINLTAMADGMLQYPNGERHNYRDLISLEKLETVKSANDSFSSLNIEAMNKKGDISISQNKSDSGTTYTLRVKAKYFKSLETATAFLSEVAKTPSREIYKWVSGLSSATATSFAEKQGNELKLDYLKQRLNAIGNRLTNLGGIPEDVKSKVTNLQVTATTLTGELHTYFYEPSAEALKSYVNLIKGLQDELTLSQKVLEALQQGSTVTQDVAEKIETYSLQVATLEQQMSFYKEYIEQYAVYDNSGSEPILVRYDIPDKITDESAESKAFTAKLEKLLADIQSLTDVDECGYYKNTSLVSYDGAPVRESGSMGFLKSALISAVAGLVVALAVAYIVGWIKSNKSAATTVGGADGGETDGMRETQQPATDLGDGEADGSDKN